MKKLPFVVRPKVSTEIVGNEEIGQIKLLKVNGRLAAERVELDEEEFKQTRLQLDILKLARDIATKEEMSVDESFTLLQSFNLSDPILSKYLDPVSTLLERQLALMKAQDQAVTAVIRHRVVHVDDSGNDVFDAKGALVVGIPDWEVTDTHSLTDSLISAIYAFYVKEMNGGKEVVEAEKNEPMTNKSEISKESSLPIGETSTGESKVTEPETNDSALTISGDSLIG